MASATFEIAYPNPHLRSCAGAPDDMIAQTLGVYASGVVEVVVVVEVEVEVEVDVMVNVGAGVGSSGAGVDNVGPNGSTVTTTSVANTAEVAGAAVVDGAAVVSGAAVATAVASSNLLGKHRKFLDDAGSKEVMGSEKKTHVLNSRWYWKPQQPS